MTTTGAFIPIPVQNTYYRRVYGYDKVANFSVVSNTGYFRLLIGNIPPRVGALQLSGNTYTTGGVTYYNKTLDLSSSVTTDTVALDTTSCQYTINNGTTRLTGTYIGSTTA